MATQQANGQAARIAVLTLRLRLPWVHSLKEKRAALRPLLVTARTKFNVSAAESGAQDVWQTADLTFAAVAANDGQAGQMLDALLRFVQGHTEADVEVLERQVL